MPFEWKKFQDGARFKFVEVNDHIEGTLTKISVTNFGGTGEDTPELHIQVDPNTILTVTASQTVLCSRLAEAAPEVGDFVSITYVGEDKANARPGRSPAKLFDVIVKRGEGNAATAPPPPPPPTGAALPAVPGYPPPTQAQLADPAYKAWYDANLPKSPPPPPPAVDESDMPF